MPARTAAVLALASAVVHVVAVDAGSMASLAMAGMSLTCLVCAWHLCRAPTTAVWVTTVAIDVAMLVVHVPTVASSAGHVHAGTVQAGMHWPGVVLVAGSLIVGLAVLATAAVQHRSGARRPPPPAVRAADPPA